MGTQERAMAVILRVRPYLQSHGGDVSVTELTDSSMVLKVEGACAQCSLRNLTYNKVIKTLLAEEVPEITQVVLI